MKFTEDNCHRIINNLSIIVEGRLSRAARREEPYILITKKEAVDMSNCAREAGEMVSMLADNFSDQFHHNPRTRRICPNEKCKTVYAYFYEDFLYCPKCGTKLTTGVKHK